MNKQYQKTCEKCGKHILVKKKSDFALHVCGEEDKPKKEKKKFFSNESE